MKYIKYIFIVIVLIMVFIGTQTKASGGENCSNKELRTKEECESAGATWTPDPGYQLLAPLPCVSETEGCNEVTNQLDSFDPTQPNNLSAYLNIAIKIIIGLAAVLSVVMIVVGGVEYMTSELSHTKEAGKEKILHAILGLLVALGAYALLYTINPSLLKTDNNIPAANPAPGTGTPAIRPAGP